MWVRDGWSASEKAFRDEAQAAGSNSPIVFVFLPRLGDEELKSALAGAAAAKATIDAEPTPKTSQEGAAAHQAMDLAPDLGNRTRGGVRRSRYLPTPGSTRAAATRSRRAACHFGGGSHRNALARLFPNFKLADDANWGKVVKRAGEGAGDPLSGLGYTGNAEEHPVMQGSADFPGRARRRAAEVRKQFGGAGYGWPQRRHRRRPAGAGGRQLRCGPSATASRCPPSRSSSRRSASLEFKSEAEIITATQRIGVRKLIQDLGLAVKNGEEAQAIPLVLQKTGRPGG